MTCKTNQTISEILYSHQGLRAFLEKLSSLEKINQAVFKHLEPAMAKNCRVLNLRQGILILATTSPAWNHQLRFLKIDLLNKLRAEPEWCGLKTIETKVNYLDDQTYSTKTNTKISNKKISKVNANLLIKTADNITSVSLANALKKLASHCET